MSQFAFDNFLQTLGLGSDNAPPSLPTNPFATNPLTPTSGPVPPADVKSSIPNWFSPTAWAQTVGGTIGKAEALFNDNVLAPAEYGIMSTGQAITDAKQTVMSKASGAYHATADAVTSVATGGLSILKWVTVLAVALIVLYLIGLIGGVKNALPGAK